MTGISYDAGRPHRGQCSECGKTGSARTTVMEPPGVAAWTCPHCGATQEPPRPSRDKTLGEMADEVDRREQGQ